ncbi:MAG: hypothetical protein JKY48_09885, partial [Flavobacteriales bacterium]|nr:hypothetical protein [Flavobacteriales bacterium]
MFKNTTGKILFTVFIGLFLLSAYFITHSYFLQIKTAEENILAKLEGISKTLSAQMDGYKFKMVLEMFSEEDEISNYDQHPYYLSQHQILKRTKELNSIQTS